MDRIFLARIFAGQLMFGVYSSRVSFAAPENCRALLEEARAFEDCGRYPAALKDVELALQQEPTNTVANYRLASILAAQGNFKPAVTAISKAVAREPRHAFIYTKRAEIFLLMKLNSQALKDSETAVALDCKDPLNYFRRGMALAACNKPDKALIDYQKAIKMDPRPYFLVEAITLLMKANRYTEASTYARELVKVSPSDAHAQVLLGDAMGACGESPKKMLPVFDRAVALEPRRACNYAARANVYLAEHRYFEALKDAQTAITLDHGDPHNYYREGQAYAGLNQFGSALKSLNRAIAMERRYYFLMARGAVYFKLNDYARAVSDDSEALRLSPHQPFLLRDRGIAQVQAGSFEQGAGDLLASQKRTASGASRSRNKDIDVSANNSVSGYTTLLNLNPQDDIALYNRGRAYVCLEQHELAAQDLSQVVRSSSLPSTRVMAACCANLEYRKLDKTKQAAAILDQVSTTSVRWPQSIVQYLKGRMSVAEVLETAKTHDELVRTQYYLGSDMILKGQKKDGSVFLLEALRQGDKRLDEVKMASVIIKKDTQ